MGELRDRGWALAFQREEDGAAAIGKLVDGDDGLAPPAAVSARGSRRETVESKRGIVKSGVVNPLSLKTALGRDARVPASETLALL
jgi:hypothetical protein